MAYWIFIWIRCRVSVCVCRLVNGAEGVPPYGDKCVWLNGVEDVRFCSHSTEAMHYGFMHMTHDVWACIAHRNGTHHNNKFSGVVRCSSRPTHVNHTSFCTHCEITGNHLRIYFTRNGFRHIFASIVSSSISFPWIQKRFFFLLVRRTHISHELKLFPFTFFYLSCWSEVAHRFRSSLEPLLPKFENWSKCARHTENRKRNRTRRLTVVLPWNQFTIESTEINPIRTELIHWACVCDSVAIVQSHIRRAVRDYVRQSPFPHFYFYSFK